MKHRDGVAKITFVVFDNRKVVDVQKKSFKAPGGMINLNGKEIDLATCR